LEKHNTNYIAFGVINRARGKRDISLGSASHSITSWSHYGN